MTKAANSRRTIFEQGTLPHILILLLLLAVSLVPRIQHIRADPPRLVADLSGSAGEFFDEAIYGHNARNKILFDRWIMDEWNPLAYNALLSGIYFLAFRLFGVSIVGVKGVNILFGCLGVIVLYSILLRYHSRKSSAALALLFSLDYYWVMYNRLGLLENFSALAFLLAFFSFVSSCQKKKGYYFVGLLVALAILSKYLNLFFFAAAFAGIVHHAWQNRKVRPVLLFLSGFATLFLAWFVFIFLPFSRSVGKIGASWGLLSFPRSFGQWASNLLHQPGFKFLSLVPLLGAALILFFSSFISRCFRPGWRRIESSELFVFLWIVGGGLALASLNYRPLRYYLPLVPALYLGAGCLLRNREAEPAMKMKIAWPIWAVTCICFLPFFRSLVQSPSYFYLFPALLRWLAYIGIAFLLLFFSWSQGAGVKKMVTMILGAGALFSLFLYFSHFFLHPTYNLEIASSYIRGLAPGSVIMGQEAPRLGFETRFPLVMAYEGWFNDEKPFATYRPTHLLVLDKFARVELTWILRRFPAMGREMKLERRFYVWDTTISLFAIKRVVP